MWPTRRRQASGAASPVAAMTPALAICRMTRSNTTGRLRFPAGPDAVRLAEAK